MRRRHLSIATVFLLALALVLSGSAQLGVVVLCVGSDCHVAVESAADTCCSESDLEEARAHSGLARNTSSCDDCIDVPLRVPPFKLDLFQLHSVNSGARHSIGSAMKAVGADPGRAVRPEQGHRLTLAFLSSVILLT